MNYSRTTVALIVCVFQIATVLSQDGYAAMNGGTTGGRGGETRTVSTEAQLVDALKDDKPRIVKITSNIWLSKSVSVGSNKSILGASWTAGVTNAGFEIKGKKNIIIQGLRLSKAVAPADGISIDASTNIWIDHNEFFSTMGGDKDFYDGLLDAKNGADFITVSWNKFHDHQKTSLLGQSEDNGSKDKGKMRFTFHHNYYLNMNSRLPSLRFGTAHIYNSVWENIESSCINSRMGAQVLVKRCVFINADRPITTNLDTPVQGFAVERENNFGNPDHGVDITQRGTFTKPPYGYNMDPLSSVYNNVKNGAGATRLF